MPFHYGLKDQQQVMTKLELRLLGTRTSFNCHSTVVMTMVFMEHVWNENGSKWALFIQDASRMEKTLQL